MDIETFEVATPVESKFIRIPISGPKPWNQLVFIRCDGWGRLFDYNELFRYRMRFSSQFKIDDFEQQGPKWYQEHTYISATGFCCRSDLNTELTFIGALEDIKGFVDPVGRIGFETQIAMYHSRSEVFEEQGSMTFDYSVSAYVLLYEKPRNPPPAVPPRKPGWMPKIEVLPSQFGRRRNFRITEDASLLGSDGT